MPEKDKDIEGVEIKKTGHKHLSDMQVLYRLGSWHNWDEAIHWLETKGEQDNELTPGETVAMTEDLRKLKSKGAKFTSDAKKVCEMADRCELSG